MKRISPLLICLFVACLPAGMAGRARAGSVQFSTYYPAPFGIYDRLRLPPRAVLTTPCDAGTFYYETGVGLKFCDEAQTWGSLGGGVWTQSGNNIYPADTASNPNLMVGIGTASPLGGIGLHLKTSQWTYGPAAGMIIQAATAGDSPGLMLFDANNYDKGALGLASLVQNWSYDALVGDVVLRSSNGRLIFSTESIAASPPYPAPPNFRARMLIDQNGNVGIGTTNPNRKLDVAGDILVNGLTIGMGGGLLDGNTANGLNALYNNTTGNYNTANGAGALLSNTTGGTNTAIGAVALRFNTTGGGNTAIGVTALHSNTTGNSNTAIGVNALSSNTTGNNNTANGMSALSFNTTGDNNTANGVNALSSNTTGLYNTANGMDALYDNTIGNNNTVIGYSTGRGITTGSNNTIIGANVGSLPAILSNNIIIADGSGNRRINVDSSGNVGIGTTSPAATLHVAGTIKADGGTPIYQCPNGDPDYQRNQCVGQLTTNSQCLLVIGGVESTASCTLVGRLVAP